MSDDDNVLKLVILGEGRVGKTSILLQYFKKTFNEGQISTVNPNFYEGKNNFELSNCLIFKEEDNLDSGFKKLEENSPNFRIIENNISLSSLNNTKRSIFNFIEKKILIFSQ